MRREASRFVLALVAASGLSLAVSGAALAAEEHSSHESGHSSGGSKGKGPKYMGGDTSHSTQTHKGGSHHHDTGEGGSKSVEGKIFSSDEGGRGKGGPKYMGGKTGGTDHHEGETEEHTH